jgi:2-polyprenyl-3-methyl-5-hydroxy-6-metoxy-1,4-benzoquinol methylase
LSQPAYDVLGAIYDRLQQAVDPVVWSDHIEALQYRFKGLTRGDGVDGRPILLDLGCGTGSFCLEMERRGYDPIGIDQSPIMLGKAREKAKIENCSRSLFLMQNIARFELYGTVDLIVCLLDTINHLTAPADVSRFFARCANYLNPGGLLIFDAASADHLQQRLGNQIFFVDEEEQTLLWQNHFSRRSLISRSEILLFTLDSNGQYTRSEAVIRERIYDASTLKQIADTNGFSVLAVLGNLTQKPARRNDSRHFYICQKKRSPPHNEAD